MDWTNLVILSLGLASGAGIGWFVGTRTDNKMFHPSRHESIPSGQPSDLDQSSSGSSTAIDSPSIIPDAAHTEIQTLKDQLQRTQLAYQMARQMAQFQAGFLARTSHELRSPINSVISLHQLILADLAEDPVEEREFVAQANQAAQKMLALLDQLIGVSKAVYGSGEVKLQSLSLWEALAEMQQFIELQARNRNLRLNIELPEPDILVWADRNWLQRALLNLVDGPIALMQEGCINLTTEVVPALQQVHIYIEDERPAHFWYEPIDLLTAIKTHQPLAELSREVLLEERSQAPSPSMTLLITQTLLELMGGHLEVLSVPTTEEFAKNPVTRIQCSLPLARE